MSEEYGVSADLASGDLHWNWGNDMRWYPDDEACDVDESNDAGGPHYNDCKS